MTESAAAEKARPGPNADSDDASSPTLIEESSGRQLSGAQIILECLLAEGVDTVFGYPGGTILPTYDSLYDSTLNHILVRHEQGAVHMAEGYARLSGKPGVVVVTSGPGATNTVTGIADANMDSIPLVVLCGQVPTSMIGNDAFQEADIVGITRPCTKHNILVKDVRDLPRVIHEAFFIAGSGRPGPVLIDLPKDVQTNICEYRPVKELAIRGYRPTVKGNRRQVSRALDILEKAERPLLYVGGGVQWGDASDELRLFAEKLQAPVTTTLMGLGTFPASDPLAIGMLGMHGGYWANMAVQNCDALFCIAARFDDRVTGDTERFACEARGRIIHADIDPSSISKVIRCDVPIVGDVGNILSMFNEQAADYPGLNGSKRIAAWRQQIADWKAERPLGYEKTRDGRILPLAVFEELHDLTKGDAIISTDVGQHQMWCAQLYGFDKPRSMLTSGGLGTMGIGLPAAIGAAFVEKDRPVVVISGDGSIQMNIQEFSTAVQYNVPVKVIVLNNGYLGMVRQWQDKFYEKRFSQVYFEALPDFPALAEAYGAKGMHVEKIEELRSALQEMLDHDGPVLLNVTIPGEEGVFPMVPAGMAVDEMLFA